MERNIVIYKIKNRIAVAEKGSIFIISDFLDLASYDAVRKALSRLAKDKHLSRVWEGSTKNQISVNS